MMKKNDLMNGDMVVLRSDRIAVVIGEGEKAYLHFQSGGFEFLEDYYSDDLIYGKGEDAVMQVFRSRNGFGFEDVDEEVPIYERDETWTRPSENKRGVIFIIAQGYYGNRTGTELRRESIDRFILGYQTDAIEPRLPIDRTIVRIPDSKDVVLVYNKYFEAEWLEKKDRALKKDNYKIEPLATIPEYGLEIYSRCIACRMTSAGELKSIREEDLQLLDRYLAR